MNRLFTTLLLVTSLFSTVAADSSSLNGDCAGLDVIISPDLSAGIDSCTNAQSIKLDPSRCASPTNGACPTGMFFYANATIDSNTNLPNQCCSLVASSNFTITDYIERFEDASCSITNSYVSALRSFTSVQSIYSNGTKGDPVFIAECQAIQNSNMEFTPAPLMSVYNSFIVGISSDVGNIFGNDNIYQNTANVLTVSEENCIFAPFDRTNPDSICPNDTDTWNTGFVLGQQGQESESLNVTGSYCCSARLSSSNGTILAKQGPLISNPSFICDYGTLLVGRPLNIYENSSNLICAGVDTSVEANSTTTTLLTTVTVTSTTVPTCIVQQTKANYGNQNPAYGNQNYGGNHNHGYGNLTSIVDPYSSTANGVMQSFAIILFMSLLTMILL